MTDARGDVLGSASRNPDAVAQQGEFHASVGRSGPMTTHGHKEGVQASPKDRAPEFHAQTLPPGSAPKENTFRPNANTETPPLANYQDENEKDPESEQVSASDTLGGASSADVHQGLGHPGQGQTSAEIRHDGSKTRSKQETGLVGVGASGVGNASKIVDPQDPKFANQRGMDKDEARPRDTFGGPTAEEREPETSETVAAEAPRGT